MKGAKADYHAFVICEDREVKYRVEIPRKLYEVGDYVPVHVMLNVAEQPIFKLQDIRMETAYPRIPVAEALSRFAFFPRSVINSRVEPAAARLREKVAAMQTDVSFSSRLKSVREIRSLAGGDLKYNIENRCAVVPLKLNRPGLHTFKVEAFSEVEGNGPVARTDVVSIMVGPGKPSKEKTILRDLAVKDKDRSGVLAMITPRSESGFLFGAGLADEFDVKVSGHKCDVGISDLLDGSYHVEITRSLPAKPGVAADRKKTKVSILFKEVLIWEGGF